MIIYTTTAENNANVCFNNIISFIYNNDTYGITTTYVIDYKSKIINGLKSLSVEFVNTQKCNWYLIKDVWNIGINTGSIYTQGPNYNISKISEISEILSTEYPITETIVGIIIGLIPLIILFMIYMIYNYRNKKMIEQNITLNQNLLIESVKRHKRYEIIDKIRNYYLKVPNYDEKLESKDFKKDLYADYPDHYNLISEYINKYENLDISSDNICIKCKKEKDKLYKNKFGLNECENCNI